VQAIQSSTDPLIVLMRSFDPDARAVRKHYNDQVDAVERRDGAAIARARFEKTGFTFHSAIAEAERERAVGRFQDGKKAEMPVKGVHR